MSDAVGSASRRRWLVIGGVVAAAVVVGAIVTYALVSSAPGDGDAKPSSSASSTRSSPAPESPAPTASATDDAPGSGPTTGPDGRETQAPVPISSPATPEAGVGVRVAAVEAVDGEAAGPGETAGPAIRVTIEIANDGSEELDLTTAVVNVFYGDGIPASQLSRPGGSPFPSAVAAESTATGVFVFVIPTDQRQSVQISVDLALRAPIVVFEGAVP